MLELKNNFSKFIVILILVTIIDMIWIQTFAKNKYQIMIKDIQGEPMKLNMRYAVACYIIIALLVLLLINKNFGYSELFLAGLFTYGIFDLTNASVFNKWDIMFGLADMIWGGILFLSTGYVFNKIK
jgi:uncharacterized membrane protein